MRTRGNPRIDVNQAGATLACRFGDPRRKCRHSKQLLLYLTFRRFDEATLILATLPFALAGAAILILEGFLHREEARSEKRD